MNKYEKEVQKQLLDNEKQMLKELEETYTKALASIKKRISELQGKSDELTQSKVYQINFQKYLERQVTSILELLKNDINSNTNTYLAKMYEDGYIGTSYDFLKAYGLETVMPIDQKAVLDTVNKKVDDMTFAERTDVNMKEFKTSVKSEISRGFATSRTYAEIAQSISLVAESQMYKAYRIARTEGLRVVSQSKLNYAKSVKEKYGADLVKKWDSTLDGKTRPEHQQLDGQIRELDEDFECSGGKAQAPGMFGNPAMDCNCRCCLLQIPRWAVDVPLTKIDNANPFKENGEVNLIEAKDYSEYKKKYFKYLENDDKITIDNLLDKLNIDINKYDLTKSNDIQEKASALLKMNYLPKIVNNNEFQKSSGKEIVRYLRDYQNITAKEAYNNTLYGAIQYSDVKNSQYGRGIYFGDKINESELEYTYGNGNGKSINAKISENANILEFNSMLSYIKDVNNRISNLPENLKKVYEKERSLLYMLDGYDGIKINGKNYYCIYNRKVLIIKNGN